MVIGIEGVPAGAAAKGSRLPDRVLRLSEAMGQPVVSSTSIVVVPEPFPSLQVPLKPICNPAELGSMRLVLLASTLLFPACREMSVNVSS